MNVVTLSCDDDASVVGVFFTPDKAISRALNGTPIPGDERMLLAQELLQIGQATMFVASSDTPNYRLTLFSVDTWY
jgi:hypothetical protein